jgi:hypothetical protein
MTRMSSTEPLAIDYVDSHARLRGDDVELVLCGLPRSVGDRSAVVLSRAGTTISAPAQVRFTDETREVRIRTSRAGLSDGYWKIALVTDESRTVSARLLVQGARPVVLVLGATAPSSVVPGAAARGAATESLTTRQRAARAGGKVLDGALRVLPAESAAKARRRARSLARTVLR